MSHSCPLCTFSWDEEVSWSYCPSCGQPTHSQLLKGTTQIESPPPPDTTPLCIIGRYHAMELIGKGGMGEVYLAFDTLYGRYVALKRIVATGDTEHLKARFIEEARITSQLTHPSIISIHNIFEDQEGLYYTMPYVRGETLRDILKRTRLQELDGEPLDHVGGSIPALMQIFISVCQAIGYAHNKGVLHRDLKLENIIIGPYGEVMLLDWGLAQVVGTPTQKRPDDTGADSSKTRVGVIVGTVHYLAPERVWGAPATVQSDIYALGVILYQMLTLHHPFRRESLKHFRKIVDREEIVEPSRQAPYREISQILTEITRRCLAKDPKERYTTVDALLKDLQGYLEGRAQWFSVGKLQLTKPDDWEFREHVLIAEHTSAESSAPTSRWVQMMLSSDSFSTNIRIETTVTLGSHSQGIGLLFCVPENQERRRLNDGYCMWFGTEAADGSRLLRSSVEVLRVDEQLLSRGQPHQLIIQKLDDRIDVWVDDTPLLHYISQIPLRGTHVGIITVDSDYKLTPLEISVSSHNAWISCLSVPDAFLSIQQYDHALVEYRRIGYAFSGRAEGRDAKFRAGLTLLEKLKRLPNSAAEEFDIVLEEFEKLRSSPGAPLEYLGKAQVYQHLQEVDEELKCYELAYRRYPKHPLLSVLNEHILYRLHDAMSHERYASYGLALLVLTHQPQQKQEPVVHTLFKRMTESWETLPWMDEQLQEEGGLQAALAFWLARPWALVEQIEKEKEALPLAALLALVELGSPQAAVRLAESCSLSPDEAKLFHLIAEAASPLEERLEEAITLARFSPDKAYSWFVTHLFWEALDRDETSLVINHMESLKRCEHGELLYQLLLPQLVWAYLQSEEWQHANELFEAETVKGLLFFLYGCWLEAVEGQEIASVHWNGMIEKPNPPTEELGTTFHSLRSERRETWVTQRFLWEKRHLYRQLALLSRCRGEINRSEEYHSLALQQLAELELSH